MSVSCSLTIPKLPEHQVKVKVKKKINFFDLSLKKKGQVEE